MIKTSCPGKVMLAGEYSVLFGGRFLASTVKSSMNVTLQKNSTGVIKVLSPIWEKALIVKRSDAATSPEPSIHIFSTLDLNADIPEEVGVEVTIKPENFEVSYGIGSSSAIRISILTAANALFNLNLSAKKISWLAYVDQKSTQGKASGYDIITQCTDGLVKGTIDYDPAKWPGKIENIAAGSTITNHLSIYVGTTGAPTASLVNKTLEFIESRSLQDKIITASEELIDLLTSSRFLFKEVRDSIINFRECFKGSAAYSTRIEHALSSLPGYDELFTWKTTGAGGEDAILVFGPTSSDLTKALDGLGYKKASFQLS